MRLYDLTPRERLDLVDTMHERMKANLLRPFPLLETEDAMPKGTKASKMKEAIMRDNPGMSVGSAIAIAQSKAHQSYATGKKLPPKGGKKR